MRRQVLYGANAIVVEEVLEYSSTAVQLTPVQQLERQKQVAQVFSLYSTLRGMMQEYALAFISKHEGIRFWVQKWRAKASRRQGAKSARSLARGDTNATDMSPRQGENGGLTIEVPASTVQIPTDAIEIPTNVRQASAGRARGQVVVGDGVGNLGGELSFQVQGTGVHRMTMEDGAAAEYASVLGGLPSPS